MIATVPWPELLKSIQRIVHAGSEGLWVPQLPTHDRESVSVRCYATSNFLFATLVASQSQLAKFSSSGQLQISSHDEETVLLNFCPTAVTLLDDALNSSPFVASAFENAGHRLGHSADPVLIFGRVLSVELLVPSHAIDVMASTRFRPALCADMASLGLN